MKRAVLFLLFTSIAVASCTTMVDEIYSSYGAYVDIAPGAIDCNRPYNESTYASVAKVAEEYKTVSQCFREEGDTTKSNAYYELAGEKYMVAAEALCDTDPNLKMQLYISAGDAYRDGRQTEKARQAYQLALNYYQRHQTTVYKTLHMSAEQKLYELDRPLAQDVYSVGGSEEVDWLPFAIAGAIVVGILLVVLSLRK